MFFQLRFPTETQPQCQISALGHVTETHPDESGGTGSGWMPMRRSTMREASGEEAAAASEIGKAHRRALPYFSFSRFMIMIPQLCFRRTMSWEFLGPLATWLFVLLIMNSATNSTTQSLTTHPRECEVVVGEEVEDGVGGVVARAGGRDVAARPRRVELAVGVELAAAQVPGALQQQAPGARHVLGLWNDKGMNMYILRIHATSHQHEG